MKKDNIRSSFIFFGIIALIIGISYINYNKRAKKVDFVERYISDFNGEVALYYREGHFNIFDKILKDRSQTFFVIIFPDSYVSDDNGYFIKFDKWTDPMDPNTHTFWMQLFESDTFYITKVDILGAPIFSDTLALKDLDDSYTFITVHNWVNENMK